MKVADISFKIILASGLALTALLSVPSCQDSEEIRFRKYMSIGKQIYQQRCQHCHGQNGEGLGKLYPPLDSADYLKDKRDQLACIIRHGQAGPIEVNGIIYNQVMPSNPDLYEDEIAHISTYILNAWSNNEGIVEKDEILQQLENCK